VAAPPDEVVVPARAAEEAGGEPEES